MTTKRKLELIIEMLEAKEIGIAFNMVKTWGELYKDASPIIAKFVRNDSRKYWAEYEPMLSDLKAVLEKESLIK